MLFRSPIRHENLGAPWPDGAAHNARLAAYARAVDEIAASRGARHVPLFELTREASPGTPSLTTNGIQPSGPGYRRLAERIEENLFGAPGPWRTSTRTEPLRRAIITKNEWFFHRSRPANMAYIFGLRKREQGRNATEVVKFDEFIASEEARIAKLRGLQLVDVPEIPRRVGNAAAVFTPQAHPRFEVADGLEVSLWAENPLLHKPIQMNFDARGRLWVASSELYPQIEPGQAQTDKIIVLEDTTGAGKADKATVFAEGLLIPTGLEVGHGEDAVGAVVPADVGAPAKGRAKGRKHDAREGGVRPAARDGAHERRRGGARRSRHARGGVLEKGDEGAVG